MDETHLEKTLEIPTPRDVLISPFGCCTILESIHRGSLFTIYRGEIGGRQVCLKTPSASLGEGRLFHATHRYTCGSEAFYSGSIGAVGLDDGTHTPEMLAQIASSLLVAESQTIQWTAGRWNHSVLGLGVWSEQSIYGPGNPKIPFHLRFRPVMVTPWYDATPFASLPHDEKRELFPRMLPALFDALVSNYHGDLSETNILVASDRSMFHLVDPGVIVGSSLERTPDSWVLGESDDRAFFTTTPANYAMLPPFKDSFWAGGEGEPGDLISSVAAMLDPERIWSGGVVGFGFSGPSNALSRNPEWAPQRRRPYRSDLLALGTMFYRIVTGEDLFFDRWMGLERAAWIGALPSGSGPGWRMNDIVERYPKLVSVLNEGYVARKLAASGMSQWEQTLADALISLKITDADHLRALSA